MIIVDKNIPVFPQQEIITSLCCIIGRREKWRSKPDHESKIIFDKYINNYYITASQSWTSSLYFLQIHVYCLNIPKENNWVCMVGDKYKVVTNYTAWQFTPNFYNVCVSNSIDLNLLLTEIVYELL